MCNWIAGWMSTDQDLLTNILGFKALGAEIDESSNTSMKLVAKELRGAHIF